MVVNENNLSWFFEEVPVALNLEDEELCKTLLETDLENIKDIAKFLVDEVNLDQDDEYSLGPLKYQYKEGDSYDWHIALGCVNCGAQFDIRDTGALSTNPKRLICSFCGFSPCPRHTVDSDSSPFYNHCNSPLTQIQEDQFKPIYLHGVRRQCHFSNQRKEWWQEHFLPQSYRDDRMKHQLRAVETLSKSKGQLIKEECSNCGHNEAYYHTFQARSADEGMTIMYECCKCGSRKVFNN